MIYLDYNATTPLEGRVMESMLPYLSKYHGNPSSGHAAGAIVREAVSRGREQVAALLGASADEIVFTSSGSESNNHALKGVAHSLSSRGDHIITSAVEHPAILMPCDYLERRGLMVTRIPVDGNGVVDPENIRKAITPRTILVSVMHANNEVGSIQPIAEISRITREAGVLFHTDAAQTMGKIRVNVDELGVDLLSLAGHKLYAPAGIGALYIRRGVSLEPLIHGAGHESGRRAGTEATANIVALGAAAEMVGEDTDCGRTRTLCGKLHALLCESLGDMVVLNGHPDHRLPNTLNVGFRGLIGARILSNAPEICASAGGAACHATDPEPSAVLKAMGVPREVGLGAIRFSLGRPTTDAEIEAAAEQIVASVRGMV
jgi:cysteine desulfurase